MTVSMVSNVNYAVSKVLVHCRPKDDKYARGATDGAPQALQVLDRWHLIGNARDALTRLLERLRSRLLSTLSEAQTHPHASPALSISDRDLRRGTKDQARQQQSRARRYKVYAEVKALH